MKTKLNKLLALVMCLVMLISCTPLDALAAVMPVNGETEYSSGISLASIVTPPDATATYVFMNGDTEFARQILKDGEKLNNPGTPTADSANKEFVGWFDESGKQLTFPITASVGSTSSTINVNARFADVYFVFFTNEKGEVMVTKKGTNGETISTDGVTYPVGNEQSIVGWKDASGNTVTSVTLTDHDVTLTAIVENGHWITYDSQDGTYVQPAFVKGNDKTTAPTAPSRPGYTFEHWSENVGGEAFTFGNTLTTALTLYAVWTPKTSTQYTVIHWQENANDDDYSFAEPETKYGTTGAQTSATAKSYTGFTLNTDDKPLVQETIAGDGSTIVNVYYKRDVYKIEFLRRENHSHTYDRRERINRYYIYYGGCYPEEGSRTPTCGKNEGYNWNVVHTITAKWDENVTSQWPKNINGTTDWRTSQSGNTYQVSIDRMPRANKSFYDPYTSAGETSETETAYYYVESLPGGASDTTYNGKNYYLHHSDTSGGSGFNVTSDDQYEITGFTFAGGTAIGAHYDGAKFYYTRNSYNIIYINNGVQDKVVSKLYEESIEDAGSYEPARPSTLPDTFTFGGWYVDPTVKQAYDFTGKTMPAQNITVYAKWNEPTVSGKAYVTIDGADDGTVLDNVTYGGTITSQLNELQATIMDGKTGYTWRGWRTGPDGTGEPFNVDTKIYSNITLYPYYTKDGTFSVTYVSGKNDVTAPTDSKKYAEDSYADLMATGKLVSDDGQYFLGWTDGQNTYQPRDKYQIKSELATANEIKLTAVWGDRPATVSLTYKANGGKGADRKIDSIANNDTVTTIENPFTRDGYTFKGWDTNPKGEGSIAAGTDVQVDNNGEGDNILYAIWTANTDTKYTVEFYYQNTDGTYMLKHSDERKGTTDTTVSVTDDDTAPKESGQYVFEEDNENNVLSGTVAGAGTLVLKLYFKLNTAGFTIHHYLKGTTVKVADDDTGTLTIGDTLTASESKALYKDYANASVDSYDPEKTITIAADETKNVITVYYTVPLTITAANASKTYDGTPLTQPDFTIDGLVNGDTKDNFTLSMTAESTITDAGTTQNVIDKATVKYKNGSIPSYYNVAYKEGKLTIKPVETEITVTANSAEKTYDGTALTDNGYTYTEGVLATGDVLTAVVEGSATNVGDEGKNVVTSYKVMRGETDVTKNYTFTESENGELKVTARDVTFTGESDTLTYTGSMQSITGIEQSGLVDGHTYESLTYEAKGQNVGSYDGAFSGDVVIKDAQGNDVTKNYNVKKQPGKLTITNASFAVTFKGESAEKVYNGKEQSITGITVEGLLDGHKFEGLTYAAKGTDKGEYEGAFTGTVTILDENNVDVTENYAITKTPGKLTITAIATEITITANSADKTYDGTALTDSGYTYTENVLVEGDVLTAVVEGSQTDAGSSDNVVKSYKVMRGETDVTKNYTFTESENGELKVTARGVTFTGESATLTYTGSMQSITGIEQSGLVDGHTYESLTYEAKGQNVGSYDGAFSGDVVIKDAQGNDVTKNYNVKKQPGKLTITNASFAVTFTGESAEKVYNGKEQSITGITVDGLKTGHKFEGLSYVAKGTDKGEYEGAFTGTVTILDENNVDVTENYAITKTPGKLTITAIATEITITANSASKTYDGTALTDDGYTYTENVLVEGDVLTAVVEGSATNVGDEGKNVVTSYKVMRGEEDVTGNYTFGESVDGKLTINPRKVTLTSETASKEYDGTPLTKPVVAVTDDGFVTGEVSDIRATGSVTYVDDGTVENTIEYTKNASFKEANYDIDEQPGTLTITAKAAKITITANSASKTYDGTALTDSDFTYTENVLVEGDVLTAVVEGSATNVGDEGKNVVKSYKVMRNGEDVTGNYTFTDSVDGKLTINKRPVKLVSADDEKEYDGTPLTNDTVTDTVDDEYLGFVKGEGASYNVTGSQTNVGESENTFTYKLNEGTKEGNYDISTVFGKLTVTAKAAKITITANSNSKTYDGTELTDDGFTYTENVLVEGDVLTAVVEGSQTDVGSSDNVVKSYKVMRGDADVTKNYTFTESGKGTLKVTPAAIELTAGSANKAYDGTPLTNDEYTITKGAFVGEEGLAAVTIVGSQTLVGNSANTITGHTLKEGTLSQNYAITYQPGELKVTQNEKAIIITANSHTWEYDGQPHSDGGYTVEYDGQTYTVSAGKTATLPTGDVVKATITKTVTNVSDSAADNNTIDELTIVNAADADTKGQYATVTLIPGTLTITKRGLDEKNPVKIVAEANTVEYDGKAHGAKLNAEGEIELGTSYTTVRLVDGHYVDEATLDITGSQTNVGVYENELKPAVKAGAARIVIRDAKGSDVTDNYELTLENATLTITGDKLIPDKKAEDEDIESNYKLGDKIEFTITVKNVSIYEVKDVVVTDANAEIQAGAGYTVSEDKHTATIASIASGDTVSVKAEHTVTSDDILKGTVNNEATVSWEDTEKTVKADTDKIDDVDTTLTVTKETTSEPKNGETYALGETIEYAIKVKNEGNVPYYNVKVDDPLTGLQDIIQELKVGEEIEYKTDYTVTEADILAGNVKNTVTAKGDDIPDPKDPENPKTPEGEGEVTDETDDVDVTLTVTKTSDYATEGWKVPLGGTITYTIKVKNEGNVPYYNVKVDDPLTGLQDIIQELKVGEEIEYKTDYTVTEADILAGNVENTVTAKGDDIPDPKDPEKPKTPEGEADVTDETGGYSYKVKYYRQMLKDNELSDEYELIDAETETFDNIGYGWTLTYDKKDFAGFCYAKTMKTLTKDGEEIDFHDGDTMPANDDLEIHVYYVRRTDLKYTIEYRLNSAKGKILSETKVVENCVYGKTYIETPVDLLPEYICDLKEFEMLVTADDSLNRYVFIYAERRIYTVEYYYEGVLDTTKTEYFWARLGTVITNYTPKSEGGYRLDHVENCPLMVVMDGTLNVIRVYYTKTPEIIIPDVPIGSGPISLNVGDCFE